uniref:Uncharacterized protein n=1 Tax=Rhizophora mucronata TaxID=61149 RepID=A0A2P2Q8P2_RHIMU
MTCSFSSISNAENFIIISDLSDFLNFF